MSMYQQLLQRLQSQSASGNGTAIFYSGQQTINGQEVDNEKLAQECQEQYSNNSYTISNTQAGKYLKSADVIKLINDAGNPATTITSTQYEQLWEVASQMMAQQAKGNVIAFVDGSLPSLANSAGKFGTFENYEFPTLLGNSSITSINGINISTLDKAVNNNPSANFQQALNLLGPASSCFDDGTPPTASAPITSAVAAIQADVSSSYTSNTIANSSITPVPNSTGGVSIWEVGASIGLGVIGLALYLNPGTAAVSAVAAAIGVLTAEAASAKEVTSQGSLSSTLYSDEQKSYDALEVAPSIAQIRTDLLVASGALPASSMQSPIKLSDIKSLLQANGNASNGVISLPSGEQFNVSATLDNSGNITYSESVNGSGTDGNYILLDGSSTTISSENITFDSNGNEISNIFNLSGDASAKQNFGYKSGVLQYTQTVDTSSKGVVTATISGTGDIATLNNATITLSDNTTASINGTGNTINLVNNDNVTLGELGNTINMQNGSTVNLTSTGTSLIDYFNCGINRIEIGSSTEKISLTYNNSVVDISGSDFGGFFYLGNAKITGNNAVFTIATPQPTVEANATVTGSSNLITIATANTTLSLSGNENTINAENGGQIILAANSQVNIKGSYLVITAAAGDNITLTTTPGTNHIIGSGAYNLTLNGVSEGTGNHYGTFGFAGNKEVVDNYINSNAGGNPALQEIQTAIGASGDPTILEGAKWDKKTVTWNSGNIDNNSVFQHDIEAAFKAWSKSTGIDFVEVGNSNKADILLGFSNLDTATTGLVGYTNYSSNNGFFTSANISLENPNQDSLINTKNGLTYSDTDATFKQVLEHEIGHAIGFGDNNNPNSIMDYYLGSSNQSLSKSDITAANALYNQNNAGSSMLYQSSSLLSDNNQFLNNHLIA